MPVDHCGKLSRQFAALEIEPRKIAGIGHGETSVTDGWRPGQAHCLPPKTPGPGEFPNAQFRWMFLRKHCT